MFETVPSLEQQGVVLEYAEGVEMMVARAGGSNKKFSRVLTRLSKPHRRAIQTEILDEKIGNRLMMEAYAEAVVMSWKGFTKDIITKNDEDGDVQLECTQENIIAVFEALPELFADVQKMSQTMSLYRAETLEADSGN
jgi:hypothetical protein